MILYCVRHGESSFNAEGRIQGQADPPLSELGRRQGEALATAFDTLDIDAIFASPLERAWQTAQAISRRLALPVRAEPLLMELNAGCFQGLRWEEVLERYPADAERWKSHDPDYRVPGGETRRELMARGQAAIEAVRRSGCQRAVVVSHGGVLSAAFKGLLGIPVERNPFALFNCSISTLAWGEQFKLLSLNQIDHLNTGDLALKTRSGDL